MWTVNCDLVTWTQPSGPLCLWQCLFCILFVDLFSDQAWQVFCTPFVVETILVTKKNRLLGWVNDYQWKNCSENQRKNYCMWSIFCFFEVWICGSDGVAKIKLREGYTLIFFDLLSTWSLYTLAHCCAIFLCCRATN